MRRFAGVFPVPSRKGTCGYAKVKRAISRAGPVAEEGAKGWRWRHRPRAEHRDEVADFGARRPALVGQPVERRAQAADHICLLFGSTHRSAGRIAKRVVAAHHGAEIPGRRELVVQARRR